MKNIYVIPEIKVEELKKQDVLCESEVLVDNHTTFYDNESQWESMPNWDFG